jgi:predicted esterase
MSDAAPWPLLRHASTTVHGRYLVRPPASRPADLWLVGFHGQGQTADSFFEAALDRVPTGPAWLVVSVQALNRHYIGRARTIGATWMTAQDRELAIADNVAWVDRALDLVEDEFGTPREVVFGGFSQGVAMAYRVALLGRRDCAAVIACCGDVPPELLAEAPRAWPPVLAATGKGDTWYTPARLASDADALAARGCDVRTLVFDGGHEWPDALGDAAGRLLRDVERAAASSSG